MIQLNARDDNIKKMITSKVSKMAGRMISDWIKSEITRKHKKNQPMLIFKKFSRWVERRIIALEIIISMR